MQFHKDKPVRTITFEGVVFEYQILKSGQDRRYGDSYYHHLVKPAPDTSDEIVERFCQEKLRSAQKEKHTFYGHVTSFYKHGDIWVYNVTEPYCD